ncbi:hypothetical protein VNO78_35281 [Psophocarpus tetragonolobus]|uniref:Mitochondrial protein n=1 Tax=Psophocarpus tetragonolobus TaxID=3891 RepID=A0AAN9RGZ4_PSOTE
MKGACWFFHHPIHNRMKPGEKEVNTLLLRNLSYSKEKRSFVFVFLQTPIRSRSPLLTGSRLISLPLATKMFQFAKFLKSKERRLAAELGYGFPIGDPWITDGISPWPFASESVLPSQCPGIHPMHSFRSCTQQENECANAAFASIPCLFASHRLHKRYTEDQANLDENQSKPKDFQGQNHSARKPAFKESQRLADRIRAFCLIG